MKKQILLLVFCAGWLWFPVAADIGITPVADGKTITETNKIDLRGKFETGGLRSGGDAVTAEIQGNVIVAMFHKDIGNLLITLTNGVGDTVYEATVNTSVQPQEFIPLSGLPSGIYTITFSNNSGSMYGDFEI